MPLEGAIHHITLFEEGADKGVSPNSDNCCSRGIPLRHGADAMNVGGEGRAFPMRRNEQISEC